MNLLFAEILKKLRREKGLSQRELAELMYVTRSAVARWETGSRLPDAAMLSRLAGCLGTDVNTLLNAAAKREAAPPQVIMVDDRKIFLSGALPVLEEALPEANVTGFTKPSEALEFAGANPVALAFLDIELGKTSGLDLCRRLLALNPCTNVVYLTAYMEYSFNAWDTGACGFLVKPLTLKDVEKQLTRLRHPVAWGE